jgi:hypothetical protein
MPSSTQARLWPAGLRARLLDMSGASQAVGSLVAVLALYWLYWLIAVPLIEPSLAPETVTRASEADIARARAAPSARKQALEKYFPPGSWELANPAIWENGQTLLLFKDAVPAAHGQIKVRYCTVLFFPPTRNPAELVEPRPVIMRAPAGATIQFEGDEPIDFANLHSRRLVGGFLEGPITIARRESRPGAHDDVLITTRDIRLANDRAFSPHPVNFRVGRSHGSGQDLEILLETPESGSGGFRSSKVRALLLKRDVVMHLALDDALQADPQAAAKQAAPQPLVRITCQGPFQYDFERYAASFHDRVDVVRLGTGQNDILNCSILSVLFDDGADDGELDAGTPAPADTSKPASSIPVRKIEARGDPVTLRSPSRGIYVHSRGLDYWPAPAGAIGRMAGIGPGVAEGTLPGEPGGRFHIEWSRELSFVPAEGGQFVATLDGGAGVRASGMGGIKADDRVDPQGSLLEHGRIMAWLTRTASPAASTADPANPTGRDVWLLDRVLAQGNVQIDVPQLLGNTTKLEATIDRTQVAGQQQPQDNPAAAPARRDSRPKPGDESSERFKVVAGSILVNLLPDGESFNVKGVTLETQAHLEQLTPKAGSKPMVVDGDRVHVADADNDQTRVTVAGRPARISAAGVALLGEAIELEKLTNRLWVDGAGTMIMPMAQDLDGRPLAQPQSLEITWLGGMSFQSDTVVFDRDVRATSGEQWLTTPRLEAVLARPIDFRKLEAPGGGRPDEATQLSLIRSHGETRLHGRGVDERGQQTSIDEMHLFDLSIDRTSGEIRARGPGWLRRIAKQDGRALDRLALPGQQRPKRDVPDPAKALSYLHVDFQREITGNLHRRDLTLGEPTTTVYGLVRDWNASLNAEEPESLGPEGMVLTARQLTVREMPARDKRQRGWFELLASGNVQAEGAQFDATGHQATYSQEKDLLVLAGDGRSPAEIRNKGDGGPSNARAHRIDYALSQQYVTFTGAQGINFAVPQNKVPNLEREK